MLKILLRSLLAISIGCAAVGPSSAGYFSNLRGAQTAEARQASAKAFASMAQLMAGLSILELADEAGSKVQLNTATNTMKAAADEFQVLAEKHVNLPLD